jgi:hypothetical protein
MRKVNTFSTDAQLDRDAHIVTATSGKRIRKRETDGRFVQTDFSLKRRQRDDARREVMWAELEAMGML